MSKKISQEQLKQLLDYDPETGIFRHRRDRGNRVKAGTAVGCRYKGYIRISINRKSYRGHRLAWLYVYGHFPEMDIDHINGIRHDNRIVNLRLATQAQNNFNARTKVGASGIRGVHWHKKKQKWHAQATLNYKRIHLGFFDEKEDAAEAYRQFAMEHHGKFLHSSVTNQGKYDQAA